MITASPHHRIGAVAGGLLGHQVGGGKDRTLATVGGVVAGGYVGNRVQKDAQDKKAYYTTERRCHNVTIDRSGLIGRADRMLSMYG